MDRSILHLDLMSEEGRDFKLTRQTLARQTAEAIDGLSMPVQVDHDRVSSGHYQMGLEAPFELMIGLAASMMAKPKATYQKGDETIPLPLEEQIKLKCRPDGELSLTNPFHVVGPGSLSVPVSLLPQVARSVEPDGLRCSLGADCSVFGIPAFTRDRRVSMRLITCSACAASVHIGCHLMVKKQIARAKPKLPFASSRRWSG